MTLDVAALAEGVTAFVRANAAWAPPLAGALAFAESLAFVSLLVPATALLVGFSLLIGAGAIDFWPTWAGAVSGAILGDWLSYAVAWRYREGITGAWPFRRYPWMLARGEAFFLRYGWASVFLGRFFGPVRAVIPVVAALGRMPFWPFQAANVTSAIVWAGLLLGPGFLAARKLAGG